MPNTMTFTLDGLAAVQVALDNLTPEVINEVEAMQRDVAETAAATIRGLYTYREGNLVKGVRTRRLLKGRLVAAMVIENTYWLAGIYDHGTMTVRETKQGYSRGKMPSRPVFRRTTNAAQREAHERTVEILRRHGLTVLHAAA
jgi:hypothetical protein